RLFEEVLEAFDARQEVWGLVGGLVRELGDVREEGLTLVVDRLELGLRQRLVLLGADGLRPPADLGVGVGGVGGEGGGSAGDGLAYGVLRAVLKQHALVDERVRFLASQHLERQAGADVLLPRIAIVSPAVRERNGVVDPRLNGPAASDLCGERATMSVCD